jgi:lipoyl(octanoyl) transferase
LTLTSNTIPAYTTLPKAVLIEDWGLIDYKEAWDRQTLIHNTIKENKISRSSDKQLLPSHLIFCEHNKVFTLGRSGKEQNLLINEDWLRSMGIDFYKINRGGDITFHGPGQLVMYPILDLDHFFSDVHRYVRTLEEIVIKVLAEYELQAFRNPDYTGVWLKSRIDKLPKKICALGVHMSRWITLHGIAFNINTDLTPFDYIVPCGIRDPDKGVTSLHLETDKPIRLDEVKEKMKYYFAVEFECNYI